MKLSWARNHESRTWVERYEVSHSAASPIVHLTLSWACSWISWSALSLLTYWSVFVIRIWITLTLQETLSAGMSRQYNEHDDAVIGIIEFNVCSPRTENTRPYGLSGYYNSRSWTSHQKILWLKQRADCLAIERHYANKSFNTSPAIVPVQRCFFNHPLPDKGRDGRRQRKINSRKTGRA